MILIDFNQVMLASLFASIGNHHNIEVDENLIRHMFLNSIRANRKKFFNDYGEIVICADGTRSWRKEIYPFYKANRKKSRDESELNWAELFEIINTIRSELKDYFPYKVVHIEHCEADDIIGVVTHKYGELLNTGTNRILILSGDKDYIQLQKYANVDQFDPVRKKWVRHGNPDAYLMDHILKGDKGDGVPNILSEGNTFVVGKRQKTMTAKRLDLYRQGPSVMDQETKDRYERNRKMIDLELVPDNYKKMIIEEFEKEKTVGRSKLFNFFVEKKLKNLFTDIGDF